MFLGRELKARQVHRVDGVSKSKVVYTIRIRHRDEVEAPLTDWLREAYAFSAVPASKAAARANRAQRPDAKPERKQQPESKTKQKSARRA